MPLLCGLLLLISATSPSLADQRDQKSVASPRFANEERWRERLELVDFLNVALSTSLEQGRHLKPPEPAAQRFSYTDVHSSFRKKLNAQLPWLYRRVFRADAMPRLNVINKWETAPTIMVGFPDQPGSGKRPGWGLPTDDPENPITPVILDEVARHLPILREATHLNIGVSQDNSAVASNAPIISIIPYSDICASDFNTFKVGHCASRYTNSFRTLHDFGRGYVVFDILTMAGNFGLTSVVPFTPNTWTQVDGALFPDGENRLNFALCFVWSGHTEIMVRSLVTECVFRAMGLPNVSSSERAVVFGKWNAYLDNDVAHETKHNIAIHCKGALKWWSNISKNESHFGCEMKRVRDAQKKEQVVPSAYDISLIKKLYSMDVERGRSNYQIIDKLLYKEKM